MTEFNGATHEKVRLYLRVARNTPNARSRHKVDARTDFDHRPLKVGGGSYSGPRERQAPTAHFAVDVIVPRELLDPKKPHVAVVAEIALDVDGAPGTVRVSEPVALPPEPEEESDAAPDE